MTLLLKQLLEIVVTVPPVGHLALFVCCPFSLSNLLVIFINYISFESLEAQDIEIGHCVTMEMVL